MYSDHGNEAHCSGPSGRTAAFSNPVFAAEVETFQTEPFKTAKDGDNMVTSSIVQDPTEPEPFEIAPSMVADSTMDAVEVETFDTFDSHDFEAPILATNTSNQIIALAIRNPVIPTDDPNGYANLVGPAPVTMTVLESADGALGVSVNSDDTGPGGTCATAVLKDVLHDDVDTDSAGYMQVGGANEEELHATAAPAPEVDDAEVETYNTFDALLGALGLGAAGPTVAASPTSDQSLAPVPQPELEPRLAAEPEPAPKIHRLEPEPAAVPLPSGNPSLTTTGHGPYVFEFAVGDRVRVSNKAIGVVMFAGMHKKDGSPRYGVGLDFADGKNNGSVGGHTYFSCEPSHGVLVKPDRVTKADEALPADGAR